MPDRESLARRTLRLSYALSFVAVRRPVTVLAVLIPVCASMAQQPEASPQGTLPDAPAPQQMIEVQHPQHHPVIDYTSNGTPCEDVRHSGSSGDPGPGGAPLAPCPHHTIPLREERFTTGTEAQHLTVKDKARMAERDLTDPYDAATVAADSSISIATSPTSRYGTGATAYGKSVGVGLAQDSSSEVTNTFLIPSLTHQDPQYHREPGATKMHRVEHAFVDVAWTESDRGKGMPNYSNLVGSPGDQELADFYVPGVRRSAVATAERYGTSMGMAPVDNLVTEFAPDVASHVHLKSAFWQDIVDKVAGVATNSGPVAAARHHPVGFQTRPRAREH